MDAINILYYEPTSGFGGSSRCLLGWLKKLDKGRYNPIVVVHYNGPAIKKIKALGTKTIKLPYKSLPEENFPFPVSYLVLLFNFLFFILPTTILIWILAQKYSIKIFHLNAKVFSVIPGIVAAKLSGKPCICHLHDIKGPVKREKFFARWIDCFVVLTGKAYDLYKKEYPNKRLELIPNGIDLDDYKTIGDGCELRKGFGIKDDERVAGIAGRLVEGKGFSDFIKAGRILAAKRQNLKFMIVGSASEDNKEFEEYLKKLVKDFNLEHKVIFTGWREDVKEIMSIFDVLVQASSTFPEGFGLTVVEAMALRKPVIVTNVPGPSEIVVNGETGYIVSPANPEELAGAIEKIILNDNLAAQMGEAGFRRVCEYFNLNLIVNKLGFLYESMAE